MRSIESSHTRHLLRLLLLMKVLRLDSASDEIQGW